jgi:thymidylate synthase (FAD)
MKIIKPSYEIMDPIDGQAILKKIELIARVSHRSEGNITETSAAPFVKKIIKLGDESVLEHVSITVRFVCDRGVSHELVRHRIAAFTQESTRYCNYSKDGFGNEITVIQPCFLSDMTYLDMEEEIPCASRGFTHKDFAWYNAMQHAETFYFDMLKAGATPEEARSVLPNSLKTEVVCTANLREIRHILKLRCNKRAHPQIRELMVPLLHELQAKIPVVFDDIAERIREQNE